ncbi:MAG: hypothetical protein ACJA1L_000491 [Paracoccaceae bacterium]|jgi:hypothetical protein
MTKTLSIGAAVIATALIAGCSSKPDPNSFGVRLQNSGGAVATIGEKWSGGEADIVEGRELISDGEDNLAKGEKLVSSGKSQINKGEAMVRVGERAKREAEDSYRLLGSPAGVVPPSS